jgi:hypothetical protein
MTWQRVRIEIPEGYAPSDREAIASDIRQYIIDRTATGVGVKGEGRRARLYDFPEYTPAYRNFKGPGNVNLRLSSEMLDAMEVLSVGRDSVLIGYENGTEQNDKAEGNITGSYGKPKPNPRKARNFLGMTTTELESILAAYDRQA